MARWYNLGVYEKAMPSGCSIEEKLHMARQAGFDFMEISIDESDEKLARLSWTQAQRCEARQGIARQAIPIRTMCLSGHRRFPLGSCDPGQRARALQILQSAVDLASDLGIRLIQLAGYDVYYTPSTVETQSYFKESLFQCVHIAAQAGVMLGFETMETPFMDSCGKALSFVKEINSPYLQLYPDIGNMTNAAQRYGYQVGDDLMASAGHLAALHLKEAAPGRYREVPYGFGQVDFPAAIRLAYQLGCRLFNAEFWYSPQSPPEQQLRLAYTFLTDCFVKSQTEEKHA